jgi:hypothetical protein
MKTIDQLTAASPGGQSSQQGSPRRKAAAKLAWRASRLFLTLGVALCASAAVLHAQNWETIYEVPTSGAAQAVVSDAAGNLYLAGSVKNTSTSPSRSVIMKSSDGGLSWDSDPSTPDFDDPSDAFSGNGSNPTTGAWRQCGWAMEPAVSRITWWLRAPDPAL